MCAHENVPEVHVRRWQCNCQGLTFQRLFSIVSSSIKRVKTAIVGLTLMVTVTTWLVNKGPSTNCGAEDRGDSNVHTIRATEVVVQPWLGTHHVYGIFTIPDRYKQKRYTVSITTRSIDHYFVIDKRSEREYVDRVFAPPGHYILQIYVRTRVALWFLFTGQFGDLKAPCNWALLFVDQAP